MEREIDELNAPEEEPSLLDGEYVVVANNKCGTLFIEARIRDDEEEEMDIATVFHDVPFSHPQSTNFFYLQRYKPS